MPNIRKGLMGAAGSGGAGNTLYMWGYNTQGTLGLGNTTNYSSPVQVPGAAEWTSFAIGGTNSAAIRADGTLWTWGTSTSGEGGRGNLTTYSSPVQVGTLTDWASINALLTGTVHAVKTDGTLWGWGLNTSGELGDGTTVSKSSPVQIGALTDWSSKISGAPKLTHAVKTDGTLWGWGYTGSRGGLGDNTIVNKSSPVQLGSLTTWANVYNAKYNGCAVKTDGTLWGWGRNFQGEIGNSTFRVVYSSPVQVGALTTWVKCVPSGSAAKVAVKTDGTLWSWGEGGGNNTRPLPAATTYSSPVQVGSLTDWADVFANGGGGSGGGAIKTDGTFWGWGANNKGGIGDGTTINRTSPVQVGSLTTWGGTTKVNAGSLSRGAIFFPS